MPSAYISRLSRELQEGFDDPQPSSRDLRQRLTDWYDSLPEISRARPFAMVELERALGTQGRYLSEVLLNLGWQRRRKWVGARQYHRYWVPPLKPVE